MNAKDQRDRAAAAIAACEAVEPLREAHTKARKAFITAKSNMDYLDAKNVRVWSDTYSATLKARREA